MTAQFKIFSGNANRSLAESIARELGQPLGQVAISRFSDAETRVEFQESVRRYSVVLVQSTCGPHPNAALAELEFMIDAARRASATEICVVIPYYGYGRQDRHRMGVRAPVSARVMADRLETQGAHHVMVVEPHSDQLVGFFHIPCDQLLPRKVMIQGCVRDNHHSAVKMLVAHDEGKLIVGSPDPGGTARARAYARALKTRYIIVDKDRPQPNTSKAGAVIGDVKGCTVLLVDDIIDTAGTITGAAQRILEEGAEAVYACCVHPVLSGEALERIRLSAVSCLFVSNTIPLSEAARRCLHIADPIDLGPFIAQGIKRMLTGDSVSELST